MKKAILLLVLAGASGQASAGFLDFLFGKKEAEPDVVEASVPAAKTVESTALSIGEQALGLLPTLTQGLGISDSQAEGGMGALLQLAQKNLSGSEFGSLSSGIPGAQEMLAAVPAINNSSNGLGGMLSKFGGEGSSLGALGLLTQQFEALGLSPDMVLKLAKLAIDYFSKNDGQLTSADNNVDLGELLKKGLGSIL